MKVKKRLIILAVTMALTTVFCGNTVAQKAKFGHLDYAAVIQTQPEIKDAEAQVKALQDELTQTGEALQKEFYTLYQEYQANESSYTSTKRQVEQQKLLDFNKRLEQFKEDAETQLLTKQQELLQPIQERVLQAIKEVAEEEHYTYIFDINTTLFHTDSTDITKAVQAKLDSKK